MGIKNEHIPVLAITMGDPAGIGPEIAAKTFELHQNYSRYKPILVGHALTMTETIRNLCLNLKINKIEQVADALFHPGIIDIIDAGAKYTRPVIPGTISAEAGDIAFLAIKTAIDLALDKSVDGTVTGPIHKEAINKAGHKFSGHTEIYAHFTNTKKYAMLLIDEDFRVIHVTTHVSLRQACDLVKKDRILEVIQLLHQGMIKLGINDPHIGVAGLNPHSGDGGLFGTEEIKEILPAIEEAGKAGIHVSGPVPADTLFALARNGRYDACVAMYHDQGHIPFKLLSFEWDKEKETMKSVRGVNITLGLPIVRTSVDHGTAFEIAGKGIASPGALIGAIEFAIKLLNN